MTNGMYGESGIGVARVATKATNTVVPAKKAAVKKAAVKKASATTRAAKAKRATPTAASSAGQAKFPRHSVERALRIPRAVYDQNGGNPVTNLEAAKFVGAASASGKLGVELSSAKKYGFFGGGEGNTLVLTDRARRAIAPQSETDRTSALQEAVLAAPELSDVYNFYRGEYLPDGPFFRNALADKFHLPADKIDEFLVVFNESIQSAGLLDVGGDRPRLLNVGRDQSHQSTTKSPATSKVQFEEGATCFVMQPFSGTLGGYYDLIFKPAIEQTGLKPVRADAEIFGTGKIIDQIWRGINSAQVLVAELTTKNANVFYELGLAHALRKPVVLVSADEQDVPFDLRHIRVIVYDQADPFWGQKLIDKIADNIKSAITNPEEAIFPVDEA